MGNLRSNSNEETRETKRVTKSIYSAKAFIEATKEFIEENFSALAEIEDDIKTDLLLLINAELAAKFYKELLKQVYGESFLTLRFSTDEDAIRLTITSKSPLILKSPNELIRLSRNAGFELYPMDNGLILTISSPKDAALSVYAISAKKAIITLKQIFSDVFFSEMKTDE